jgi:hypothetical protein
MKDKRVASRVDEASLLAARLHQSGAIVLFLHRLLRQKQGQQCGGQKHYVGNASHNIVMKETTIF